jgi:membrane-bound serine protease (ClpP class)
MLGEVALAMEDFQGEGTVLVRGELWKAIAPGPVRHGDKLKIKRIKGLVLNVVPVDSESGDIGAD